MKFICRKCGRTYEENDKVWRCECGGYLSLEQRGIIRKEDIHADRFSMWRYDTAYPMKYEDLKVSFDEGMTPLVRAPFDGCALRIKMETLMPTGSFKDRGTVMVVNWLINHGVIHITEDSSGNAGASVAGYCALAGVDCDIYVPANTSAGKLTQMEYYGAHVHRIEGNREAVAEAAQEDSASYAGHNWHPLFVEGTNSAW